MTLLTPCPLKIAAIWGSACKSKRNTYTSCQGRRGRIIMARVVAKQIFDFDSKQDGPSAGIATPKSDGYALEA